MRLGGLVGKRLALEKVGGPSSGVRVRIHGEHQGGLDRVGRHQPGQTELVSTCSLWAELLSVLDTSARLTMRLGFQRTPGRAIGYSITRPVGQMKYVQHRSASKYLLSSEAIPHAPQAI